MDKYKYMYIYKSRISTQELRLQLRNLTIR